MKKKQREKQQEQQQAKRQVFVGPRIQVDTQYCPVCHEALNATRNIALDQPHVAMPRPGDIALCAGCSTFLLQTATGLAVATERDIARLDPDGRRILESWQRQFPFGCSPPIRVR
ncbi:MAG TPA: hypothetical protein VFO16_01605 [Pseudonocardiaceae bacterium]|nr:hypothetical protein [Pseudonocardiaceae bacterium]